MKYIYIYTYIYIYIIILYKIRGFIIKQIRYIRGYNGIISFIEWMLNHLIMKYVTFNRIWICGL